MLRTWVWMEWVLWWPIHCVNSTFLILRSISLHGGRNDFAFKYTFCRGDLFDVPILFVCLILHDTDHSKPGSQEGGGKSEPSQGWKTNNPPGGLRISSHIPCNNFWGLDSAIPLFSPTEGGSHALSFKHAEVWNLPSYWLLPPSPFLKFVVTGFSMVFFLY